LEYGKEEGVIALVAQLLQLQAQVMQTVQGEYARFGEERGKKL
jgi:hypothetical protein